MTMETRVLTSALSWESKDLDRPARGHRDGIRDEGVRMHRIRVDVADAVRLQECSHSGRRRPGGRIRVQRALRCMHEERVLDVGGLLATDQLAEEIGLEAHRDCPPPGAG